jgi:uncharacterized protein
MSGRRNAMTWQENPPADNGAAALARQRKLVERLELALSAPGLPCKAFETQISWVLVGEQFAYKIKKAIRLPFLDYSTLAARQYFCQEECRLNQRMAPGLYRNVAAVTGDPDHPGFDGVGAPIEYAVRMAVFGQDALWTRRIAEGRLTADEVASLAERLAQAHGEAAIVPPCASWGTPTYIAHTVGATFAELSRQAAGEGCRRSLSALRKGASRLREDLYGVFRMRRQDGMIRECHGDLHCGNVITRDGRAEAFDCIEFSEGLRWIDVMDDLAFLYMDLAFHGRADLAASLLSRYLEITGDYGGLAVLPYYRMHRALVRAKVLFERAGQGGVPASERTALEHAAQGYLRLAQPGDQSRAPAIVIMHGYSGSGKTTVARRLVQLLGAVQIRSDVERRRLFGAPAAGPARDVPYTDDASCKTYARLAGLARGIVAAGWPVIVDAAFLKADQRAPFRALAAELKVPFILVDVRASEAHMRQRVLQRERAGEDASAAGIAVLDRQLQCGEPLSGEEAGLAVVVETGAEQDGVGVDAACATVWLRAGNGMP